MKEVSVQKIWNGLISIRDYHVEECVRKNGPMKIKFGSRFMVLTPEQLVSKKVRTSKWVITSKFTGKPYRLVDYKWDPVEEIE